MLPKHIEEARERWRVNSRNWRSKNIDRWRAYCRAYKKNHPEKAKVWRKSYKDKNPERVAELRRLSSERRRPKIAETNRSWYLRNKAKIIGQKIEYERKRVADDPSFKCKKLLKNRIVECLKQHRTIKSKRTLELIGCDRSFLVKWLESKFTEGMTWQNHGFNGWHIDHIRPCASFDLSDPEQQNQCFHYSNLQPMWAKENQIKSDKWHYQDISRKQS